MAIGKDYFPLGTVPSTLKTRSRKFMASCNLDKLKWAKNNINLIRKRLNEKMKKPDIFVGMAHDDTNKRHVVISFYFKNARTVHSVAKMLSLPDYMVLVFKGSLGDLFSYPIHATRGGKFLKRRYTPKQAFTNMDDYPGYIAELDKQIAKNSKKADKAIDDYVQQKITLNELLASLTIDEFLNCRHRIKTAKRDVAKYNHVQYLKDFNGQDIQVVVFCDTVRWLNLYNYELYKQVAQEEGNLKLEYLSKIKDLAFEYAKTQGPYKYFDPYQGYGYGYLGQSIGLYSYEDMLASKATSRYDEACGIIDSALTNPQFHDLTVLDDRYRVPLNLRKLIIACVDVVPGDLDPTNPPKNVLVIGTNSEYARFLKATGIKL